MIKTVITISLKTSRKTFLSKEFQDMLNTVKSGEMKREFEKPTNKIKPLSAAVTYWTDYKPK